MLSTDEDERAYGRAITESDCEDEGGEWVEFVSFLEVLEDVTSEAACRAEQNKGTRNKIFWTKLRVGDFHWVNCFTGNFSIVIWNWLEVG